MQQVISVSQEFMNFHSYEKHFFLTAPKQSVWGERRLEHILDLKRAKMEDKSSKITELAHNYCLDTCEVD